ncbi:MAG: quinone-dependent dihydroorotate dehydrogenase [Bacteroidales bacterium]|nr:quinone-dependent dihydroorotate dehydrogenase [Bacteroidales bacterium]
MYKHLIRPILFSFTAETAHAITFAALKILRYIPGSQSFIRLISSVKTPALEKELFGITFKNPVGIAAGLDKNGEFYNDLANFGVSFVEIGSITLRAQDGNPKPRCFRLIEDNAIINRMGINNNGAKYAVESIKNNPPKDVVIVCSLSKNASTPNELASKDFEKSFAIMYDFVDMFVLNISCPNVKDLSGLQDISVLSEVIDTLLTQRRYNDEIRPILLKISPDIPFQQLDDILKLALSSGIDGIVATNTTKSREGLKTDAQTVESIGDGGLSGAPLFERSLKFVKYIHDKTEGMLPIIGVGGIMTADQAQQMMDAGASLIEVYSGFIYNGPLFIKKILKTLRNNAKQRLLSETQTEAATKAQTEPGSEVQQ